MDQYGYTKLMTKCQYEEEIKIQRNRRLDDDASLSWHNIDVFLSNQSSSNCWSSVTQLDDSKKILRNVSGIAHGNQLLAIMGASGAGKTTLLNVLTKRTASNLKVEGEVRFCGNSISQEAFLQMSAYVQQDDLFPASLTCKEQLLFQALLRMESKMTYGQRMTRVEEVICQFGLTNCADTLIGKPGSSIGISGGEKKRLAFAAEVLTNPLLIFCDEPTSGLDSYMAQNVVSVLKEIAAQGKIVIATIHQPSSEIFAMFDRILLMAEGRIACLSTKDAASEYFKTQGFECPVSYNPAEFFISTLAIIPGKKNSRQRRIEAICDHFDSSDVGIILKNELQNIKKSENLWTEDFRTRYKANTWTQFRTIMWRSALTVLRDSTVLKARFIHPTLLAIWIGMMFFGQTFNRDVMNINGAIFILLTQMTFLNMYGVIHVFCLELSLFYREHENGMYGCAAYFWAKTMIEVPIFTLIAVLYTSITYWMTGLHPGFLQFAFACVIATLVTHCACSFGYMMSTCCANIAVALSTSGTLINPLMYFGGYYLNVKSFPNWLVWMEYLSWFRYGNEALLINQWQDIHYIECNQQRNQTCFQNGNEVLQSLNFNPDNFSYDIIFLVVQLLAYRFAAYFALLIRANMKH